MICSKLIHGLLFNKRTHTTARLTDGSTAGVTYIYSINIKIKYIKNNQ